MTCMLEAYGRISPYVYFLQDVGEDNKEVVQRNQQIQEMLVRVRELTLEESALGRSVSTEVRGRRREIHDEIGVLRTGRMTAKVMIASRKVMWIFRTRFAFGYGIFNHDTAFSSSCCTASG